ncbi:hypothetical protein [Nocardia wallacei]|uniref:hypothetical protein n=1 Tax=Nocardia wallacei TaxID=480035 RepID=UPI0024544102|nr:hypothetical protein [Nocardia wallacei]
MSGTEFRYRGKTVVIREHHPHATISVDGREFTCHHHPGPGENGFAMWMCDEAYFGAADIRELAWHFADYGYMFDDPDRVVVDSGGAVVRTGRTDPGGGNGNGHHGHAGGH